MVLVREEIKTEECWDTSSLYASWDIWEADFTLVESEQDALDPFRGRLVEGAQVVHQVLELYMAQQRRIQKLMTYAHLRQDEDLRDDVHKAYYQRATALYHKFSERASWIQPELLGLQSDVLCGYIESAELADFRFYLECVLRQKPHTLSAKEEKLLSMSSKALAAPSAAFGMLENADFYFDPVLDQRGEKHPLTLANYLIHQMSPDRERRKSAFYSLHGRFHEYSNTICELLNGEIQRHLFEARSRNFSSCLQAALFPHQIDVSVYRNLIASVREGLDSLHRYVDFRCQVLGLDQCGPYDLAVSLVDDPQREIPYVEAERLVLESVAPLGETYVSELARGFGADRWVDRYETRGKRSGAYSGGCYDSHPYILMNYTGGHRDVSTLAHEAGHSMHSLRSNQRQPYHYADYPIFVAEVASTFNEELLFRNLLAQVKSPQERVALINRRIDDIRATLFRQTLFAEFELWLHELAEQGEPLTPSRLKAKYLELNIDYYGAKLDPDPVLAIEWARIPHFYYNFYVYQYATGISAALYLVERVLEGGEVARDAYLNFLASGYSDYPVELLSHAGVDMGSFEPVRAAITRFDQLVTELASTI